jgi:hypothetical protein
MRWPVLVPLLFAAAAWAQADEADWLASPQAAQFRARVVQLALIYGDSSGIDPQGYEVLTRAAGKRAPGDCADVEVVTSRRDEVVRRETVHACRAH